MLDTLWVFMTSTKYRGKPHVKSNQIQLKICTQNRKPAKLQPIHENYMSKFVDCYCFVFHSPKRLYSSWRPSNSEGFKEIKSSTSAEHNIVAIIMFFFYCHCSHIYTYADIFTEIISLYAVCENVLFRRKI